MKFHLGNALLALSLLAVAPWVHAQDKGGAVTQARVKDTPHTASDMTELYYNDTNIAECGKLTTVELPAYLCSGIIIRAAEPGPTYNSWNPSPADVSSGGVSFSYIRKDSKFKGFVFGETSGFTLYPAQGTYRGPDSKQKLNVKCAFPLDGWTQYRGAPMGCGKPTNQSDGGEAGRICQEQGITTAKEWMHHYQNSSYSNPKLYQCGFEVATAKYHPAAAFMQMIAAMKLLGDTSFDNHNELRIATWPKDWNKELPIQSFFYMGDKASKAWTNARTDQKAYYTQTGEFVPVIKIDAPKTQDDQFTFHFYTDDQAVSIPPPRR